MRPLRILAIGCCLLSARLFGEDTPPNVPPELLSLAQEGKKQFVGGNFPAAEKVYRQMLAQAPQNLYVLSNLGVVLFRGAKLKLAEETFKKAIAIAPEDGFSHCTLGIVYYSQGKYDDAVNELTKALAIDPQNATAHNYLGITASQKGWQEAARKELETAAALDSSYADTRSNQAAPPDYPREVRRLVGRAREQFESGDYSAAEETYRKILTKMPNRSHLASNLGIVLLREGKYPLAEEMLKRALAVAPEDGFSHYALGILYYSQQKSDEAVTEFAKALAADPQNAAARHYLKMISREDGWQESTRKKMEEAIQLDSSYDEARPGSGVGDFLIPAEEEQLQRMQNPPAVFK